MQAPLEERIRLFGFRIQELVALIIGSSWACPLNLVFSLSMTQIMIIFLGETHPVPVDEARLSFSYLFLLVPVLWKPGNKLESSICQESVIYS